MPWGDQLAPRIIAGLVLVTLSLLGRAAPAQDPEPTDPLEKAFQEADEAVRKNPESAAAYIARAQAWVALGSPEHARGDLDQAVSVEPESILPYLARGTFLVKHGDLDLALQDMNKACELDPTQSGCWVCRAGGRFHQGRFSLALEDLNEALRLKPEDPGLLRFRARVQSARHEPELAIADLDEVLRLEPENADAICERGSYRVAAGDVEGGLRDFDEAIRMNPQEIRYYAKRAETWSDKKDFDRALAECELAFRHSPESWIAFQIRSYVRNAMKQSDEALKDADSAIRANPQEEVCYFQRARVRVSQKQYEMAVEDLSLGLAIAPRHVEALTLRGYLRVCLDQIDLATEDFDEAVRVGPEDSAAFQMRGKFHQIQGDNDAAAADFDEAVKWHPRPADLILERAALRLDMKELQGVHDDLAKVEELDPTKARLFLLRAQLKQRLRQYDGVLDDLDKAVNLVPDNLDARKARATELVRRRNPLEAGYEYDEILTRNPDDDSIRLERAKIRYNSGENDQALSDVDAILQRHSTLDILTLHAKILQRNGDFEAARDDLSRAIQIVSAVTTASSDKKRRLLDVDLKSSLAPGISAARAKTEESDSKKESKTKSDEEPAVENTWKTFAEREHSTNEKLLAGLYAWRGQLWEASDDDDEALGDFARAIELDFGCKLAWARQTWIEATSPDWLRRNTERGVAGDAILKNTKSKDVPDAMRILAAAYANTGDFEQAVVCQRKFLDEAKTAGIPKPILDQLFVELHLYESGKPYRERVSGADAFSALDILSRMFADYQTQQSRKQAAELASKKSAAVLSIQNYSVGDLVGGAPRRLRATVAMDSTVQLADPEPAELNETRATSTEAAVATELKALQRLIESTIEPDSWEWSDGPGTISADTSERTLQIRQTDEVHAEVERFLTALRQKRSQRVVLTIRVATLRDVALQPALELDEEPRDALFGTVRLAPDQVHRFHELVNTSNQAAGMKDLEIKLVHSQTAVAKLRRRLLDQSTEELRELKVTWSATDEYCVLKLFVPQARVFELSPDESLLVDLTDVQQPPATESNDEPAAPSAERIVLLITPRILSPATSESSAP